MAPNRRTTPNEVSTWLLVLVMLFVFCVVCRVSSIRLPYAAILALRPLTHASQMFVERVARVLPAPRFN